MEFEEEEEVSEPVSPIAQYFNSSVLSLTIIGVLEIAVPFDDSQTMSLLKNVFLSINPRFSSIMVRDDDGEKKWKRVEVNLKDHLIYPNFPQGMSREFYDEYFADYLTKIGMDQLPQTRPLWEIHIVEYPTSSAAGNVIFKLHHALGDGYSLIGALLSCMQRADNPSLPLTFPSRQMSSKPKHDSVSIFKRVSRVLSGMINTVSDFGWTLLKSSVVEDDRTPIRSGDDGVQFRPVNITTMTFSLDHLKQIKANLGVTINDVITGIIFLGTRLYMQATSHELGDAESTAVLALNTRAMAGYKSISEMIKPGSEMPWGNNFAFLHIPIPKLTVAESSDPLSFILKAHQLINRKRNSFAVHLTSTLLEAMRKLRGPESIMATMVSYMGKLRVAMTMEKGFINSHKFKACIENAYEIILEAAIQKPPSQGK